MANNCDERISTQGAAVVTSIVFDESETTGVATDNPCLVKMTLSHADACPIIDWYRVYLIFEENDWLIGICEILLGLFIGMFGLRFLRPIAGILVAIAVFLASILFSSMFGYFESVKGIIITLSCGLVAAILLGIITLFAIWLAIGLLGVLGGFMLGSLIYELTIMQFDFAHAWGFMILVLIGVIAGILLSIKYG